MVCPIRMYANDNAVVADEQGLSVLTDHNTRPTSFLCPITFGVAPVEYEVSLDKYNTLGGCLG